MMKPKTLSNGMRYHLVPFSGTEAVTTLVLTKVGSRNEPDRVWGGSHFLEHLVFKGTKRRPNTIDISKTLDRYGAQYNAYTGKDLTGYYVKIDGEKVGVAVDLLHDMLFHSLYDQTELDRERKVIIEEIKMYEENPIMHAEDLLEQAMFDGNTLGREIAGTPEMMMSMTREDLLAYRNAYYVPSEMVIVMAGKVPENAVELLEKTFGTVTGTGNPEAFKPFEGIKESAAPRVRRQSKDLQQMQLAIGFETIGRAHTDIPAIQLLANILGGAMSSRLFIEVRERRALCYDIRAGADAYDDVGVFSIRAGLDAKRLDEACATIIEELEKMKEKGVDAEELTSAKDNVEGSMKLSLENSSTRAEFFARQELFFKEVKTPQEKIAQYHAVTPEDIKRVANQVFNLKKLSIAAIGPYKDDASLLAHLPVIK